MTLKEKALDYISRETRKAKCSLEQAERRSGVKAEELSNLHDKIEKLEWIRHIVSNAKEEQ